MEQRLITAQNNDEGVMCFMLFGLPKDKRSWIEGVLENVMISDVAKSMILERVDLQSRNCKDGLNNSIRICWFDDNGD